MFVRSIILLLILLLPLIGFSQNILSGTWQGIIIKDGTSNEQAMILYAQFEIDNGTVSGRTRNEIIDTDLFAVKKIKGSAKEKSISFSEFVIEKKKNSAKSNWCNINAELTYEDSTGYLKGRFNSTDCKRNNGTIILYRINAKLSATAESPMSHTWYKKFQSDLKKGYAAPEIREKERKNFEFQPVYFDYDKSEIRSEYYAFLKKMARVVDGHSDLRIKVTGHTDGDGSDAYNIELSKKRAEAIVNHFVSLGLSKDRIVIDFKGEKEPIDNNNTPEGKQKNRRVDFSFI
jgi:outer membrane protein OmpA-like peptidoglycan-associated protein